jgi:hypothetical protein
MWANGVCPGAVVESLANRCRASVAAAQMTKRDAVARRPPDWSPRSPNQLAIMGMSPQNWSPPRLSVAEDKPAVPPRGGAQLIQAIT